MEQLRLAALAAKRAKAQGVGAAGRPAPSPAAAPTSPRKEAAETPTREITAKPAAGRPAGQIVAAAQGIREQMQARKERGAAFDEAGEAGAMPIAGPGGAPPASGIAPTLGSQPGATPAAVEIRARLDAMRERRLGGPRAHAAHHVMSVVHVGDVQAQVAASPADRAQRLAQTRGRSTTREAQHQDRLHAPSVLVARHRGLPWMPNL
ncbi:MAG: hypothetical protein AAB262_10590 [Elusimicrobiota bacterium]